MKPQGVTPSHTHAYERKELKGRNVIYLDTSIVYLSFHGDGKIASYHTCPSDPHTTVRLTAGLGESDKSMCSMSSGSESVSSSLAPFMLLSTANGRV